jgi:hypothetical protein
MGGLDFSALFLFLGIQILEILVVNPLAQNLSMSEQVTRIVIGI